MKKLASLLLCIISLSACTAAEEKPTPIMPVTQPMAYQEPAPTYSNPGSLFNPNDPVDLYADGRARRVGDVILINVVEYSEAESEANTSTGKSSNTNLGVNAFFGKSSIPLLGAVGTEDMFGATSESTFSGDGSTDRANYVQATVAARVVRVYADGLMQVEGARETRVNNETQYIVVRGLVRPRDVSSENTINSTSMADAQIEYYGSGVISDKQKPGWLTRLLDVVWPL